MSASGRSPAGVAAKLRPELIALLAVASGIALRAVIEPVLVGTLVWLTFWPAVFLAGWYGGLRGGLAALVGSVAAVSLWLGSSPTLTLARGLLGGVVFVACCLAFAYLAERARQARDAERRLREAAEVARRDERRLATLLAAAESVEDVAQVVLSEGMRASSADLAMLFVLDESTRRFHLVSELGSAPEVIAQFREVTADSEHGGRLQQELWVEGPEEYAAVAPDVAAIPSTSTHPRAAAWWCLPLRVAGRVVGALSMGYYRPRRFSAEERELSLLFAQHCAQAVARAERASRLERERLRLARLFDANLIGTVFWDREGKIVSANDRFLRSIGYTREDLAAGRVDWRALTPSEHAAADQAAIECLREQGFHEPYEKEYLHKDGHRVPLLVSSAAFFDDPTQGVTFVAELTEVKRVAEAADRAKDEFLAMLGHELRNPLAPILTAVELMELRGVAGVERPLGIIKRQVQHLARMVDDLLDVSRVKAGKVQIARRVIELNELLSRAIEMVSPLIEERRHHLSVEPAAPDLLVDVDPGRMAQVFANLLTNAAKYTDPGGRIEVAMRAEDGEVVVDVTDNGIGIEPRLVQRMFDLFTQEPQSSERSRGGLGLGLAIARMLVELHGGTLTAHSEGRGRGSRFTVRLPRAGQFGTTTSIRPR